MSIKWDVRYEQQLDTLKAKFEAINMDRVLREGVKDTADEMAEIVRTHVVNHPDIRAPANLMSPYSDGPGPSMGHKAGWVVKETGKNTYTVQPHPRVRRRAIILEYGTRDPITPRNAEALRFTINGVPKFASEVSGIEARGYWRAAMAEMRGSGKFEEHLSEAYEDELERYF